MAGMKVRADMAGLACEALNRMFQKEQTDLVAQVIWRTWFVFSHRVELVHNNTSSNDSIGFESWVGSIPPEVTGRNRPGDDRKPFSYEGPDCKGSQVHDS